MVNTAPRDPADWMDRFLRCLTGSNWKRVVVPVGRDSFSPGRRTVTVALRVLTGQRA
jgi:hypothetical protein